MPDERVSYQVKLITLTEVHERVARGEVISVCSFARMNKSPFQIVLRGNLIELFLDQRRVLCNLLPGSVEETEMNSGSSRDASVDGSAYVEMPLVSALERRQPSRRGDRLRLAG